MKLKAYIMCSLTAALILCGCGSGIKNNKIYPAAKPEEDYSTENLSTPIAVKGVNPFKALNITESLSKEGIILTLSPDENFAFIMERVYKSSDHILIKGETTVYVDLIRVDVKTGEKTILANCIPFLTSVQWSKDGKYVAFNGGGKLKVYNNVKKEFVFEEDLEGKEITAFGWAPDGKKIYMSQNYLINDSIGYLDSGRMVNSYETKEEVFYRKILDENYYYGTIGKETSNGIIAKTVVVNDKNDIVKIFQPGIFMDSFKRAMLQLGDERKGLYYYQDINKEDSSKVLTNEYVYDAKFAFDGKILYIVKNNNIEENNFILHIVDSEGKEINKHEISGTEIMLFTDGKLGYIAGEALEKINLLTDEVQKSPMSIVENSFDQDICKVLRGAMYTYRRLLENENNVTNVKKYFTNTHNPEQWAYSQMLDMWGKNEQRADVKYTNRCKIYLKDCKRYVFNNMERASVKLQEIKEEYPKEENDYSLELINLQNKWYVTGFSTFPNSDEAEEIKKVITEFVKESIKNDNFDIQLKGKKFAIGEIQFFTFSKNKLADEVKNADGCKVIIKVSEGSKESAYRMTINKSYDGIWKIVSLRRENIDK